MRATGQSKVKRGQTTAIERRRCEDYFTSTINSSSNYGAIAYVESEDEEARLRGELNGVRGWRRSGALGPREVVATEARSHMF